MQYPLPISGTSSGANIPSFFLYTFARQINGLTVFLAREPLVREPKA